jgi:hypothetical protein
VLALLSLQYDRRVEPRTPVLIEDEL